LVHGVGSGEALAEALEAADKRQLILQPDEFSHVMNKAKIDGGSLIQILLTLFEKATFDNRTKGKTYQLEGASLSFLTACVDTVFPTLFDPKGGADSGIINRFWIVAGPSSREPKPTPRVNRTTLDEVRLALHRLLVPFKRMTPQQQVLVRLTPDAEALYRDWYRNEYFPMKDDPAAARLRTYACRLIMLGAVTTLPQPRQLGPGGELVAGPEAVLAALTMVRWQYRVRRQFSPIIAETREGKMELMILRAFERGSEQGLTRREAQRVTHGHRGLGVAAWNRAFDALTQNGNLVPFDPGVKGRSEKGGRSPSLRYRLVVEN